MKPGDDGLIPAELERTCAQEPIHLLGTVQAYGFLIVADIAARSIVQVSSGIAALAGTGRRRGAGRCATG